MIELISSFPFPQTIRLILYKYFQRRTMFSLTNKQGSFIIVVGEIFYVKNIID